MVIEYSFLLRIINLVRTFLVQLVIMVPIGAQHRLTQQVLATLVSMAIHKSWIWNIVILAVMVLQFVRFVMLRTSQ